MKTHIWFVKLNRGGATYYTARDMTADGFARHIPNMFLTGIVAFKPTNFGEWREVNHG